MGDNYEKSTFNQLMEVMAKLDAMEAEHKKDRLKRRKLNIFQGIVNLMNGTPVIE